MFDLALIALAMLSAAAGVLLLRQAWRRRGGGTFGWRLWTGWSALALCLALCASATGFDIGAAAGSCAVMVGGYAAIAMGVERRQPKAAGRTREPSIDPADRPRHPYRWAIRLVIAGPLALAAAYCLSVAWAVHGPGLRINRLVTSSYLMPLFWGGAMAWACADDRLARPAIGLVLLSLVSWTAANFLGMRP